MLRRSSSSILIIIAMLLNILNFDFSSFNFESLKTWLFLGELIILIVAGISIIINAIKESEKSVKC